MRIVHLADTHIHGLKQHDELRALMKLIDKALKEEKPDLIVHAGDIVHNKISITPELITVVAEFLQMLAKHATVLIVPGNHDGLVHNTSRLNTLTPIVELLNHKNIIIMDKTSTYKRDNFAFHALSIFEDQDSWKKLEITSANTNIGIFHGTVGSVRTDSGFQMEGEVDIDLFKQFDFLMLGHIHKTQKVDREGKAWYPGSTMQCSYDESIEKGFLVWDIENEGRWEVRKRLFANPKPLQSISIMNHDELVNGFEMFKVFPHARLKVIVNDPNFTVVQEKNLEKFIRGKVKLTSIQFIKGAGAKRQEVESSIKAIELNKLEVQQSLIVEHVSNVLDVKDSDLVKSILEENARLFSHEEAEEYELKRNHKFLIKEVGWENLFSYGYDNNITFTEFPKNTIIGIFGENFSGKSSIIDVICFVLWNKVTKEISKNAELMRYGTNKSSGFVIFEHGGKEYRVERGLDKSKSGVVKSNLSFCVVGQEDNKLEDKKKNTDKEIATFVGDIEDFMLTSLMTQFSGMLFVNEKSAARRDILKRILNLGVFDKRVEEINKEIYFLDRKRKAEYKDGLEDEIQSMKDQIENFEIELVSKRAKFKDIDVEVSGYKEWLNNLSTEKAKLEEIERTFSSPINFAEEKQRLSEKYLGLRESINNGLYSVDRLPFRWFALHDNNIQALEQEIELLKRDTAAIENKKTGKESRLGWLLKEIEKFEEKTKALVVPCESDNIKNELGVQILDLCSLSKNYKDSKVEISQKRQEVFDIEKELENECGVEKIEENKKKLSILDNRLKSWKKYNAGKVVEERNKFVLNSAILSLEGIKKEYKRLVLDYVRQESTRQAREKYGDLLRQKREIEDKLFDASKQKDEVRNEGVVLRDRKTAMESKLAVILEKEKELQADLTRVTVLKILHKTLTGNSGLTITLLKKFIPLLNQVANEILSQMSQITVCLEATEKDTLELSFSNGSDGGEMRSVGVSSGAERTMISIAIRMALQALTSLPTSNLFILDEPATAFDEKRLADFENILNVIKVKFDYILLITHIDAIKEYVDTVVSVDKEDGTSRLVVGR